MKLENIKYYASGLYSFESDTYLPILDLNKSTVIFMLSGSLKAVYNGTTLDLHTGEVLVANANTFSQALKLSESNTEFFWAQFNEIPHDTSLPTHMYCKNSANLKELFNQLCYFSSLIKHQASAQNLLLQLILTEINVQFNTDNSSKAVSLSSQIYDWICENSDKKLTVEDVASKFGYSPDYLTRFMKREGYSGIKQLIITTRLDHIKALLSTTELSIKEIGIRSGFENTNDFFKFFKTHEGMTPTEFRDLGDNTYSSPTNTIV